MSGKLISSSDSRGSHPCPVCGQQSKRRFCKRHDPAQVDRKTLHDQRVAAYLAKVKRP